MIPKKTTKTPVMQELQEIKFKEHKLMTTDLIAKLKETEFLKHSKKVAECGDYLIFSEQQHIESLERRNRLKHANFCKFRFCPMCNWRRNINITRELLSALTELERYSSVSYLFLTLTIKNPPIEDLKTTVKHLNQSFQRMAQTKTYKKSIMGHFKALEIVGDETAEGEVHPHFHILLVVRSSYYQQKYYLSHAKWIEMWKKALRVDYTPVLNIKKIRPKKNSSLSAVQSAVFEVAKYSVKHTILTKKSNRDFKILVEQTNRMRFFSTGGILKSVINFVKCDEDLIGLNEEKEALWIEIAELMYEWSNGKYFLSTTIKPKDRE